MCCPFRAISINFSPASFNLKECFSSLAWLEKVAAAAQKYLDDNEAIPNAIAENLGAVIKASSPSVRKSVRAVMAVGRLSRLSTTALPGAK